MRRFSERERVRRRAVALRVERRTPNRIGWGFESAQFRNQERPVLNATFRSIHDRAENLSRFSE